jgi:hypothetical protein
VYVNDVLVDEFNIPHTPRKDSWTLNLFLDPALWSREQYQLQANPPFLKYLEFDDADQRSLDLRVEVQNDDNNHTNGFMTRYSRVILAQCWLASIKVWQEFDQIQNRWRFSRHNWHRWHGHTTSVAQYYLGVRNVIFDNLVKYADMHYPNITQRPRTSEQLKSNVSNYQDLPQQWQDCPSEHWTGSSGYFHLSLAKKLGFWRHSTDRRRGWWKYSMIRNMQDLSDKYKSYEDKRSTDQ